MPSTSTWFSESFDTISAGALPPGWQQWESTTGAGFGASAAQALSPSNGLAITTPSSSTTARTWVSAQLPADVRADAAIYANTLIPAQVLLRGSGLASTTPTYYAVSVSRGLDVQLVKVVQGTSIVLGEVKSAAYLSQKWVQVTLSVSGATLRATVFRTDTAQYLTGTGQWQSAPTDVLARTDTTIPGVGQAGLGRPASYAGTLTFDDFSIDLPGAAQSFDGLPPATLPNGWSQWASGGPRSGSFGVSTTQPLHGTGDLAASAGASNVQTRAWSTVLQPADEQARVAVDLSSLIPVGVLVRGSGLGTATPSYYALEVARGLDAQLVRVVNGVTTILGEITSANYFSGPWLQGQLSVQGNSLQVVLRRLDTGLYLDPTGRWQTAPVVALQATDGAVTGSGLAGLVRPAAYAGTVFLDDFAVYPAAGDTQPPRVTITSPVAGATATGVITVQANVTDNQGVARVELYVDGTLLAVNQVGQYQWQFDTSTTSNGAHILTVLAYDSSGNSSQASIALMTQNDNALPPLTIPRHYPHIRLAELAYTGTPFDSFDDQLLRNSIDLIVPGPGVLDHVAQLAGMTPRLFYTNLSNLYLDQLLDWLNYADAHGISREDAFYHAAQDVAFSGNSASSRPVTWFWGVYRDGSAWSNLTSQAHGVAPGVSFGGAGTSLYVGFLERFREINLSLLQGAANGWSAMLEYATAVDANGSPTAWAPLKTLTDTTGGLGRSGQITFDPPADWKAASVDGSPSLFYVRFRTLTDGTAPLAQTILGRDYVNAQGTTSGVIPAFDTAADTNHDGYLDDAEYAHHAPGKSARFLYESRLFQGYYGQMRFAANPSTVGYRHWAVDYSVRLLQANPQATGLFVDNSQGSASVPASAALEPLGSYANDYGAMLNAIARAIAPNWVLANTGGSGTRSDPVIQQVQAYFEEFALRPMMQNRQQFEDLAALIAHRSTLRTPAPYAVLDSLPDGGSPTDPRTQMATLAEYYLLADPVSTFLDLYGGSEPATGWERHWVAAAAFDVGQPQGSWSVFATGTDPSNAALTYNVYQRPYGNALVLYKPLSYAHGVSGSLADASATTHGLGGNYRALHADGTLGAVVTSVTLRNGEGVILVKA